MPGANRPSQSRDAHRRRNRKSMARRYKAEGAQHQCWFCSVCLPTERGREIHMTKLHRSPAALP